MIQANRLAQALFAAGALGMFGAAQAADINAGLTPGVLNSVQDESREAYVDANRDGLFGAGDVIFGYIRLNNFAPSGAATNNSVYGVFSQQITAVNGTSITFGATTVAGLTLSALTGVAAPAGSIASFYDNAAGYSVDLITTALGGSTSMKNYIDFITGNGTLRLTAGLSRPSDFLVSGANAFFAGGANTNFINLPPDVTVASTGGGLTVLVNNTNFDYSPTVIASSPPGYVPGILDPQAQLGVSSGTVAGTLSQTPLPQAWLNADYGTFDFLQCSLDGPGGADTACGFTDKNNFGVIPIRRVPEPGSLPLVSGALLGLAGVGRRRKDKSAA